MEREDTMRLPPSDWMKPSDLQEVLNRLQMIAAWGCWLNGFHWDHFATLTFVTPRSLEAARHSFSRWVRRLEQRAQQAVMWFYVAEHGSAGLIHVHALVDGTRGLADKDLKSAWMCGRAEAAVFDRRLGATHYVTKSVGSDPIDYDISRSLRRRSGNE